jgi:hypothetical protein
VGYVSDYGEQMAKSIDGHLRALRGDVDELVKGEVSVYVETGGLGDALAWLELRRAVLGNIADIEEQLSEVASRNRA